MPDFEPIKWSLKAENGGKAGLPSDGELVQAVSDRIADDDVFVFAAGQSSEGKIGTTKASECPVEYLRFNVESPDVLDGVQLENATLAGLRQEQLNNDMDASSVDDFLF